MSILSDLLSQFEESAKQLNAVSDSINTAITDVEQRLAAANAGLEVWVYDSPLEAEEPEEVQLNGTDTGYRWLERILGFAKLSQAEGWRLAVKERSATQADELGDEIGYVTGQITPLWKASRNLRLKALELLPILVEQLTDATQRALQTIQEASGNQMLRQTIRNAVKEIQSPKSLADVGYLSIK
jgi:hypothetical protein